MAQIGGGDLRHRFAFQLFIVIPAAEIITAAGDLFFGGQRCAGAIDVLENIISIAVRRASVYFSLIGMEGDGVGVGLPLGSECDDAIIFSYKVFDLLPIGIGSIAVAPPGEGIARAGEFV